MIPAPRQSPTPSAVTDVDEFDVTTPTDGNDATNEIDENAVAGPVGITASASDADGTTNKITYGLTSDDDGNFVIDEDTGVVSTTDSLNHEAGETRTIEVEATSADGSSKSETFNITVNDINEAPVIESGTTGTVLRMPPPARSFTILRRATLMEIR